MSAAVVSTMPAMGRWEPNARGRLEQAALELYGERGFDQTTVAEIAARAGLTERTFFRHYADKREVLFGGSELLAELLVAAVAGAPDPAATLAAETGIAVFRVAFDRWVGDGNDRDLSALIRESLGELKALTAEER